MALFSRNTKKNKAAAPAAAPAQRASAEPSSIHTGDLARVLRNPRITEKASDLQAASVYTFDIGAHVSKRQVVEAIRAVYKVTPRKVAVITVRPKMRRSARNGKTGMSSGGRKAYVYLKQGETIAIH